MKDPVARTLFLHAASDSAVLVSKHPTHHDAETVGGWLPLSQIRIADKRVAYNPAFGKTPAAALIWGTVLTIEAPAQLLADRGLTEDAALPDRAFDRPAEYAGASS